MMVDVNGKETNCQFVPFSRREYHKLTLETVPEESEVQIAQRIAEEIMHTDRQHIYSVTLTGFHPQKGPWDLQRIEDILHHREYLCTVEDQTRPDYDFTQLYQENKENLIGDFISSFDGHELTALEEKALQYGVEALLSQGTAKEEY